MTDIHLKSDHMSTMHNRRQYPRRPARFSVKYTIRSGTYRDLVGNVSAGGAYIVARQAIPSGQKISLQFPAFAFDSRPSVTGTVIRSENDGFAVMFDTPFGRRFCPADHFPEYDSQRDPSQEDPLG